MRALAFFPRPPTLHNDRDTATRVVSLRDSIAEAITRTVPDKIQNFRISWRRLKVPLPPQATPGNDTLCMGMEDLFAAIEEAEQEKKTEKGTP